jgi:MFS family permease
MSTSSSAAALDLTPEPAPAPTLVARLPFYYGWVNVVVAALAMVATLPGRTHGLGLITKPLLQHLQIGDVFYSTLNFWAILLGAAFCWPVGRLLDRFGTRWVLTVVSLALGGLVVLMSGVSDWLTLFILLVLIRGLGQGALSVVSMAIVGKWFRRRLGLAMGVYSMLLGIGFSVTFAIFPQLVKDHGWATAWAGLGWCLVLGMAPLGLLLVRSTPEACGIALEPEPQLEAAAMVPDARLSEALRMPAFWAFSLAASLYGMLASAISLFPQAVLEKQGFDYETFRLVLMIGAVCGVVSNLLGGWLATRWPLGRLLGGAMLLLAICLAVFPGTYTLWAVVAYTVGMGVAGGFITVVFFAFYGRTYGRTNLGQIQGSAQVVSVFASALGPVLLTLCNELTGSYALMYYTAAGMALLLGAWVWRVPAARPASLALSEGGAIAS